MSNSPENVTEDDHCVSWYEAWPIARADDIIHAAGKVYYEDEDGNRVNLKMFEVGRSEADGVVIFRLIGRESELTHICADSDECVFVGVLFTDVYDILPYFAQTHEKTTTDESGQVTTEQVGNLSLSDWC